MGKAIILNECDFSLKNVGVLEQDVPLTSVYIIVEGDNKFSAEVEPAYAADKSVVWSIVSGNKYATIDQDGEVSPIGTGTVTIRATASNDSDVYDEYTFSVNYTQSGGNSGGGNSGGGNSGGGNSGGGNSGLVNPLTFGNGLKLLGNVVGINHLSSGFGWTGVMDDDNPYSFALSLNDAQSLGYAPMPVVSSPVFSYLPSIDEVYTLIQIPEGCQSVTVKWENPLWYVSLHAESVNDNNGVIVPFDNSGNLTADLSNVNDGTYWLFNWIECRDAQGNAMDVPGDPGDDLTYDNDMGLIGITFNF